MVRIEANSPPFFGLAIPMYESTLIADRAPPDAYLQGDHQAINARQVEGLNLFEVLNIGDAGVCYGEGACPRWAEQRPLSRTTEFHQVCWWTSLRLLRSQAGASRLDKGFGLY
ncbi:hypothetical protein [Pseudomonas sp. DC1.2]|uniref:hypothetical protein n=1 Tax=Pseudomonas sp. DC1.2 TaxID=3048622 RepID=UPI003A102DD2